MQAVILAGGLGTRLWPITKEIPKPMVPVAGVPYLEHQLRLLARQSIRDIVILTGYLGDQIEAYFGGGERLEITLRYSREASPIGTGGALRDAANMLENRFLVIYGDSFLPIDYAAVLSKLEMAGVEAVVVVYDNSIGDTSVRNNIAIDAEEFVTRYDKDASSNKGELRYVEAGVVALRRSVASRIPEGVVSLEKQIFPALIRERSLAAYPTAQRFFDIGTPERLAAIESYFRK
jgi:mannose-1-phosphate guanylyltransferase